MLFGDWGTSRLYVLGLAFYYAGHSSLWFMLAMSGLLVAVGWAYQVICRLYPDGGGVYSSCRDRNHTLAVIGALLLCADYIITASLSALDAFHYVHLPHAHMFAVGAILLIGFLNYFGPTKAGTGAMIVAVLTALLSLLIALFAAPDLKSAVVTPVSGSPLETWAQFNKLILAISGVEAIANMTGIMVEPVHQTVKKSIWPVVAEIVILNMILTVAMLALPASEIGLGGPKVPAAKAAAAAALEAHPDLAQPDAHGKVHAPPGVYTTTKARDTMVRILAAHYVGQGFASVAAVVFALLLLSAVNTAITGLVSIQYMMASDRELPIGLTGLNRWGMPAAALWIATVLPALVLYFVNDVGDLADLYAIGVVGAVALNLGACATNWRLAMRLFERVGMMLIAGTMAVVWVTIAYEKPHALVFACGVLGIGLAGRWAARHREQIRYWAEKTAPALVRATDTYSERLAVSAAALAGRAQVVPQGPIKTRLLVATRGNPRLTKFAIEEARAHHGELLVLFVRHIAVTPFAPVQQAQLASDPEAVAMFAEFREAAEAAHVPTYFLYSVAYDIADAILETAATQAVDTLLLGTTRRGMLWRAMKGDVIQQVAAHLPDRITLLVHG
jgi:amino acid transporter/nucleotide-binding universal stress UspA family protein